MCKHSEYAYISHCEACTIYIVKENVIIPSTKKDQSKTDTEVWQLYRIWARKASLRAQIESPLEKYTVKIIYNISIVNVL